MVAARERQRVAMRAGGVSRAGPWDFRRSEGVSSGVTRADINKCIRRFPDIDISGMSGFNGHLRTSVALGVGS
jgi:hypothetical protein